MSVMTAPALPELNIAQPTYRPGSAVLLSLWPFDQLLTTYHAGVVTYGHPKAEPNKIKTVVMNPLRLSMPGSDPVPPEDMWMAKYLDPVDCEPGKGHVRIHLVDTYTLTRDWALESENSKPAFSPKIITAASVAESLVKAFSGGRLGDGIYGGAGMAVYDASRPLEVQLAEMHANQMQLATSLYEHAAELAAKREYGKITRVHRTLAEWAGLPRADWMIERQPKATKPCPNCNEPIPAMAIKCTAAGCGINLVQFAREYGIGLEDPAVVAVMNFKPKPAAAAAPAKG